MSNKKIAKPRKNKIEQNIEKVDHLKKIDKLNTKRKIKQHTTSLQKAKELKNVNN